MIKKLFILLISVLSFLNIVYSAEGEPVKGEPRVNCAGLPGCLEDDYIALDSGSNNDNIGLDFVVNIITEFIKFIAVIAVFALIFSGIMYLISMGEEDKVNNAKNWIIYSLIGVFLSVSAWGIINLLDGIRIG